MTSSQAERLRQRIEDDILSLKLQPGDRLDESKLAERYGTSRTPVREALRQLSSNGLIEIRPHKGAIVANPGMHDLVELFEVMAELEGACARLATRAGIKSDIEAIAEAHRACGALARANDVEGYQAANEAFHESIYNASRNTCLIKMTVGVKNRVAPYRKLQVEQSNRLDKYVSEHTAILDAIQQGRPDDADRSLQQHVLNKGAEIRRFISNICTVGVESAPVELRKFSSPPIESTFAAK